MELKSITLSASVDYTVQAAPYQPVKFHGHASETYEVGEAEEIDPAKADEFIQARQGELYALCTRQIGQQIQWFNQRQAQGG